MANISCPHCHQLVDSQALACPFCRTTLKAYGHPGITLHRVSGDGYLCDTCTYHTDDTCNFPQRPYAKDCTLYQNMTEFQAQVEQQRSASSFGATVKTWGKRNQALLLILGLLLMCLLITLLT
ncbi:zinc ribbon domain-containing protein [Nostoc sp. TCL26-01]|uniref:zinc ribbon domain-containing protein n=1 Tax=Nostoc sp. TCL26-01 TaxID=2576904 RepID=UPI0015C02647|nr:zinc ribbon domain-containing protein [Nostoc sp. TCL26-01]QLE55842.1 hypothetical protein FD725_10100 [Nostoc sp. TCL26-01]